MGDDIYGTVPRMDETKKVMAKVRNTPVFIAGVNYTDDPRFWGYYEFLTCWPGRVLKTSTGDFTMSDTTAEELVESFNTGDLTGIPRDPIGIDEEHKLYTDSSGFFIGYAVDFLLYEGETATYTSAGVRIVKQTPPKTKRVMVKIAWLDNGKWTMEQAQLPFPSIVFSVDPDSGKLTLGHPTVTGLPADKVPHAMVICKDKKIRMEAKTMDELIAQVVEVLKTKTPEEVQAILDSLKAGAKLEPAARPAGETPEAKQAKFRDEILKVVEEYSAKLAKAPEKPAQPAAPPVYDKAVVAAKGELIEGGMTPELADKQAQHFAGMEVEKAVSSARVFMAKGFEVNQAQSRGLKPSYPEDKSEHLKMIMARDKVDLVEAYKTLEKERSAK